MHYMSVRSGRIVSALFALTLTIVSLLTLCFAALRPDPAGEARVRNLRDWTPYDELASNPAPSNVEMLSSYNPPSPVVEPPSLSRYRGRVARGKQSGFSVGAAPGIAQIVISWTAYPGATSYKVQWHTPGSGTFTLTTTSALTVTQTTGMENGQMYWYNILAYNGGVFLQTAYSSPVVLWLPGPSSISCYVNGSGHTILNWSAVAGATSYEILGRGPYTTSSTSYDLGIIPSGTNYGVSVLSINSAGNGAVSATVNTNGSSPIPGAMPVYANAQPYCPLCALLHGAGSGDPVNLANGSEVYSPPADIAVYNPNGVGFTFSRAFTTVLSANNWASPGMGAGWTHPYDVTLRTIPGGSTSWPNLEVVYPNAATETFVPTLSSGSPTGAFTHVTGAPYIVTGSPGTGGAWNSVTLTWKDGSVWTFTPFASEMYVLTFILNQVGQGISIAYDSSRRLSGVSDYTSATPLVGFTYDTYGLLSAVNDLYGRSVFYTNGSSSTGRAELLTASQITATSVGSGGAAAKAAFTYTLAGGTQLNTIVVPSPTGSGNSTASFSYTGTGQIASIVDGNNNNFGFTYNTGNTVVKMKTSAGVVALTYTEYYDSMKRMTSVKDANGYSTKWVYGDSSNPYKATSVTNEDSDEATTSYDAYGNVTAITDPLGVTTNYTLVYTAFPLGRLTQIQTGTLAADTFTYYEPSGLVETATAPEPGGGGSVTTSFAYDALGNLTAITAPGSGSYTTRTITLNYTADGTYYQPDAVGQPLTVTDNGGNVSHFRYDLLGHVLSDVDPLGFETDYTYNIAEQPITTMYPATGQTGTGRSYATTAYLYPGGLSASVSIYDESGVLARTMGMARGAEGEVLSVSGTSDAAQYTYDAAYRVLSSKDGNGGVTTLAYDTVGNLSSESLPGGNTYSFTSYDPAHHLLQKSDANGILTNYTYSSLGHILSTINAPLDSSVDVSLGYDSYGRLTGISEATGSRAVGYDDAGNVTSEVTTYAGLPAQTVSYGLNPDGSRASMTSPAGTFSYGYDVVGRAAALTNPFGETTAWGYSARGDLLAQGLGNGAGSAYQYNALGQLTQLQNLSPSSSVLSSYGSVAYNATGDLTATAAFVNGASGTLSYVYDTLDRLTHETSTVGTGYTLAHAYDSNSNLTTLRGATLTYNSKGQLSTSGMTFDSNGNPTTYNGTSLTFDSNNRLTAYGSAMTAGYRSDRLRAWKQSAGTTTYFIYDGSTLLCELNSSGGVTRAYTNGANGLVSSNTPAGSIFYTFDHRGATVHRLDAYGNILSAHASDGYGADLATEADPYCGFGAQFGYYHDAETGLFYLQNRYYDPTYGRFLNRDPIGLDGGMNRYAFVRGNPIKEVDQSGLDPQDRKPLLLIILGDRSSGGDPLMRMAANSFQFVQGMKAAALLSGWDYQILSNPSRDVADSWLRDKADGLAFYGHAGAGQIQLNAREREADTAYLGADQFNELAATRFKSGRGPMQFAILDGCETLTGAKWQWSGLARIVYGYTGEMNINFKLMGGDSEEQVVPDPYVPPRPMKVRRPRRGLLGIFRF